jgi:anti-anti-sigma factor
MLTIDRGADGIVVLGGRLDAAQAGVAQAALDAVNGVVTLDCRGLDYVSSAGLSVLLRTQKRLLAASGKLRLAGLKPHIHDIFVYSGFDQLFEIIDEPGKNSSNFPPAGA